MAYNKEYPVLNSEKKEDSIYEYTKRQEDRIEGAFEGVDSELQAQALFNKVKDLFGDYVIETGSNSNGSWEKWASGKLEQWGRVSSSPRKNTLFNYPITFSTLDTLTGIVDRPGGYQYLAVKMSRNTNHNFYVLTWELRL